METATYECEACGITHTYHTSKIKICGKKNFSEVCKENHELVENETPVCVNCKETKNQVFLNKWITTPLQQIKMKDKIQDNETFKRVFMKRYDITEEFQKELHHRTRGEQTNHVIIFITGETGTYKSSIAQTLAKITDLEFTHEKISFTNDELLNKIQTQAQITRVGEEKSQTFVRDETPKTLRQRAETEFQNLSETMRDSRINLMLIKPTEINIETAHYIIETIAMSEDYQKVKVAILNPKTNKYLGHAEFEIHLNNYCNHCKKLHRKNQDFCSVCQQALQKNKTWNNYMKAKKEFQKTIVERQIGQVNYKEYAEKIMEMDYFKNRCLTGKEGSTKIKKTHLTKLLRYKLPTLTNQERQDVLIEIEDEIFKENIR